MGARGLDKVNLVVLSPISEIEKIPDSKFERFRDFLTIIKSDKFIEKLRQRGCDLSSLEITEIFMRHYYETISSKLLMRKKGKPDKTIRDTELVDYVTEDSIILILYSLVGAESTNVYIDFEQYIPSSNRCFFVAVDIDEFFQDPVFDEEDLEYFKKNKPPDFVEKEIYKIRRGWITGKETGGSLDEHRMRQFSVKLNLGCAANQPESVLKLFEFVCNVLQDESLYDPPHFRYIDFYND
ncbi:hypothetical protein CEE45_07170 [Candidatus Heimdallarchaeota archaeon B3_Heim]|nr:MAG: hypothetical protein CEE45_07170 [Candidatus Heimdallarchaeota archaeon B3_Heim]